MSVQARVSAQDPRLYNPSRDVAHNFGAAVNLVASRLESGVWSELSEVLQKLDISDDDLSDAMAAYCAYIGTAKDEDPQATMLQCIEKSGFLRCKPGAQVAVMAMIGMVYSGYQFNGVREATINREGPLMTVADLVKQSDRLRRYLRKPWLLRRFYWWCQRRKQRLLEWFGN